MPRRLVPGADGLERHIELVPNCSLTPRGALGFFVPSCLVSFGIAALFVAQGLWPVLPFAGLEMLLLGSALAVSVQRRRFVQSIIVTEARVEVVTRDGGGLRRFQAARHWARARWLAGERLRPGRLVIESRGTSCELGALLCEQERRELYRDLRLWLGEMNQSPPLERAGFL